MWVRDLDQLAQDGVHGGIITSALRAGTTAGTSYFKTTYFSVLLHGTHLAPVPCICLAVPLETDQLRREKYSRMDTARNDEVRELVVKNTMIDRKGND